MGGSVSSGRNNDELVDNLVKGGLIKTPIIERVFRAVDRGIFYLPNFKDAAYRDLAWREGRIHISAPCIYTRFDLLGKKFKKSFFYVEKTIFHIYLLE
jgi:protein-L-isoaspartate O-methyltransferase